RNAAPPHLRVLRATGCARTRLPSPDSTRTIMRPMPAVTPNRQGSPLSTPACAPAAVSMMLLGPGVPAATTVNRRNATIRSAVVYYLQKSSGLAALSIGCGDASRANHIGGRGSFTIVPREGRQLDRQYEPRRRRRAIQRMVRPHGLSDSSPR